MDAFSNVAQVIAISRRINHLQVIKRRLCAVYTPIIATVPGRCREKYREGCGSLAYGVAQKSVCLAAYACYSTEYVHCDIRRPFDQLKHELGILQVVSQGTVAVI